MKKLFVFAILAMSISSAVLAQDKFVTKNGYAQLFSHTVAEDIKAKNTQVNSVIRPDNGDFVVSVPVKGFKFPRALMQKHFNQERYMHSDEYPKIKFKGTIQNLSDVNFDQDGIYDVTVKGDMTIRAETKPVTANGTIEVNGNQVIAKSAFTVADITSYGVGKPKGNNASKVADDIEITYEATYDKK